MTPSTRDRAETIALWVLRVLTASVFLFAAFMKITSQPVMVAYFDIVGLGQWFRFVVGLLELVGGAALLIPRTSLIGAALLLFVDMGAFVAQVTRLHEDWIHTVVIAVILVALLYLQRGRLSFGNRDAECRLTTYLPPGGCRGKT